MTARNYIFLLLIFVLLSIFAETQYSSTAFAQDVAPLPGFDPASIEHVHTAADAERARAELIQTIWHQDHLPASVPDKVNDLSPMHLDSDNVSDSIVLRRTMEYGIESVIYYYRASRFSGCLFIYHSGHGEGVPDNLKASLWKRLIDGGCDFLYVAMPLMDQNPRPVVQSSFGPLLLKNHDVLSLLQSPDFNPIKIFLEPVLASLNYLEKLRDYRFVFMGGISGGGWTTTLYSALDPRISGSFPVAGSLPESIKSVTDDNIGDWEQFSANIYTITNYLDLYLLGTYRDRFQVQLLNVYDSCCFRGTGARSYERQVDTVARQWGGLFSVSLDETTRQHEISTQHVETILNRISKATGIIFPPLPKTPERCALSNSNTIELKPLFRHEIGNAYQAEVIELRNAADEVNHPRRSTLILCENERSLGPNHSLHVTVRQQGNGAFSHWQDYILFSSSDNTDPNENGRRYWAILSPQ